MKKHLISKKILLYILSFIILITFITTTIAVYNNNHNTNNAKQIQYIELNKDIELKKGQTIYINEKTSLTYITSIDSRCPSDAECIWQGQIEYTFAYKQNNTEEKFTLGSVTSKEYEISNYNISYVNSNDNNVIINIKEINK